MWYRIDWNPIDGWGGATGARKEPEPCPKLNGRDIAYGWTKQSDRGTIVIDDKNIVIYLGFYRPGSGERSNVPYLTVWEYR